MSQTTELRELRELIGKMRTELARGSERFTSMQERCSMHTEALFDVERGAIPRIAVMRKSLGDVNDSISIVNKRLARVERGHWVGIGALAVIQIAVAFAIKLL